MFNYYSVQDEESTGTTHYYYETMLKKNENKYCNYKFNIQDYLLLNYIFLSFKPSYM